MRRLRIAVWHNLPSGGGKRALYYHVEGLLKRGHEITAFCPDTADQSYLPLSGIVREISFPLKANIERLSHALFRKAYSYGLCLERLNLMLDHCRQCADMIHKSDFDVLLANSSSDFYMSHIGRFVKIPKAIFIGEPFRPLYEAFPEFQWKAPEREMRRFNSLAKFKNEIRYWKKIYAYGILAREELTAAKSYNLILVNSLYSRESIMRAYRAESKVCYLGIDLEKFKPGITKKEKYVIGIGSFGHLKGIDRAIDVISRIPSEKRPELIWIGNMPSLEYINSLKRKAEELLVKFIPRFDITDEELILYLKKAAVMIYLPFLEPFGLAPLEANACGTAVVGIAEGGLKETIFDDHNGFVVRDFNPDEIASKIQLFTDNLMFANEMGERARNYVQERWNYEEGINNIESYLASIVGEKRGKVET
jgi:glycosyltransferase involved in cell wall biosynthesis